MPDDYAPFPEIELRALMGWHTQAARAWKNNSPMQRDHATRAQACEDALLGHDALRTRFLEQSMLVRSLQAQLAELGAHPSQRGAASVA